MSNTSKRLQKAPMKIKKRCKPPFTPTNEQLKSVFPAKDFYYRFLEGERNVSKFYKGQFSRVERIVLFCRVELEWSVRQINRFTGISYWTVTETFKKIKEWRF
jgi:hypothetical protein